jgi:hypothetical protein
MTASRKYNQKANIEKHTKLQIDDLELFLQFRFVFYHITASTILIR